MVKTLKIFFFGTSEPISMKLRMLHLELLPIIVCSNDYRWLTMTLFYGMVKFSNLGFSIGKNENSDFSETIAA